MNGQNPKLSEIAVSVDFGWLGMRQQNIFVSGQNFCQLFNRERAVVDHALFQFLTSRSVLKTFAVKIESCPKSRRLSKVFAVQNFQGAIPSPQKSYIRVITPT